MKIPRNAIDVDARCQPRVFLDSDVIDEYANAMADGAAFPPVLVYQDGDRYWLADGFHRLAALDRTGATEVDVEVREGTLRDAILAAMGANAAHGLRRTNEDKRRAVDTLLEDEEWGSWSNVRIAKQCGVSEYLPRQRRDALSPRLNRGDEPDSRTYVDRYGMTRTMDVSGMRDRPGSVPMSFPAPPRMPVSEERDMPDEDENEAREDDGSPSSWNPAPANLFRRLLVEYGEDPATVAAQIIEVSPTIAAQLARDGEALIAWITHVHTTLRERI